MARGGGMITVIAGVLAIVASVTASVGDVHTVRVHGLATDGVTIPATPTPTPIPPTPTATIYIAPTPIPPTAIPPTPYVPAWSPYRPEVERWRGLVLTVFEQWSVDDVLRRIQCESGGNPNATGAAGEMGLLQLHPRFHPDATYDPYLNLVAAYRISSGGTDWSPWTCR